MIWIESIGVGAVAALMGLGILAIVISVLRSAKAQEMPIGFRMDPLATFLVYASLALLFFVGFGVAYFKFR